MKKLLLILVFCVSAIQWLASRPQTPRQLLSTHPSELLRKADSFSMIQQSDSALKYYVALSAVYSGQLSEAERRLCAEGAIKAGEIYYGQSAYVAAFDSFMRAIRMAETDNMTDILAVAYKDIGNINASFNDNLQAIDCYQKSLGYAAAAGDSAMQFKLHTNLTAIYAYENRIRETKKHYESMSKFQTSYPLAPYLLNLTSGIINSADGKLEEALEDYDMAYDIAVADSLPPSYVCAVYSEKAKLFRSNGDYRRSIEGYLECADYARKMSVFNMLTESLECLGQLYKTVGEPDMAKKYNMQYLALKDSLITAEDYNRMKSEQFVYEMERNYNDITHLNGQLELRESRLSYQRKVIWVVVTALVIFIIMGGVMWWQKKRLQKAYNVIFARNEELLKADQSNRALRKSLLEEQEQMAQPDSTEKGDEQSSETDRKKHSVDKLSDDTKKRLLDKIQEVMDNCDEILNPDFNIDRLAELTDSNTRYISFVINESLGLNFRGLLNHYRIREAQRRISDTTRYGDLTLQAIAQMTGYKSYANFVDLFKRQTGLAPSVYQRNARDSKKR